MEAANLRDPLDLTTVEIDLVDDDGDSLSELEEFISLSQYRCRAFAVPELALEYLRKRSGPVVVLSDVRMPKLSGLELSRLIREMEGDRHPVEIILYSGHGGFDEAVQSLKYGVVDFLLKPIDPARLEQTILRAMERLSQRIATQARQQQAHSPALTETAPRPAAARPAAAPVVASGNSANLALIKLLQNNRRSRDRLFPACSIGDPSWEIILFVLEQEMLQRPVSVTSACHATAIPQTTAMRKIDELVDAALLSRVPDEDDRRRVLLCTTPACREAARRYFENTVAQLSSTRQIFDDPR